MINPCEECLVIPICRHRYFIDMKNRCKLVEKFLFRSDLATARFDFEERINSVHETINPVHWEKHPLFHDWKPTTIETPGIGKGVTLSWWRVTENEHCERIKPCNTHVKNV